MPIQKVSILHSCDLSNDIAQQLQMKLQPLDGLSVELVKMSSTREFKALLEASPTTLVVFIAQTIENENPPEDAGSCIRFFKRKNHPDNMLEGKFVFSVLGLGDSNLLLDRQHTAAKDCNQVAQSLDKRLEALGGTRFFELGEADERSGLTEVEPWIKTLVEKIKSC